MPSQAHQTLLLWAARKMARDGYRIVGFDGVCEQAGLWNQTQSPVLIFGIRPDAVGVDCNGTYAFGEAKTAKDIDCAHTRRQLSTLSRLTMRATRNKCRIYLAIPRSSATALDRVLADLHLVGMPNIVRLHIPDILMTEKEVA